MLVKNKLQNQWFIYFITNIHMYITYKTTVQKIRNICKFNKVYSDEIFSRTSSKKIIHTFVLY